MKKYIYIGDSKKLNHRKNKLNEILFKKREIEKSIIDELSSSIIYQFQNKIVQENLSRDFYSSLGTKYEEITSLFNNEDKKEIKNKLIEIVEYDIKHALFDIKSRIIENNLIFHLLDSVSDKMDITSEQELKSEKGGDTGSDTNMKSPLQKNKMYQINQSTNHDQFVCKKMSMDLDDDITNSNATNKKFMGCNCKNSGCLKRYCECFSRMKYCDSNCQCKNCLNNIKFEKERTEAIKIYLVKSPVSFKKINMDLNNITCNCKKSNCLKNYCECFQFGLKCTYSCGCVDCKIGIY